MPMIAPLLPPPSHPTGWSKHLRMGVSLSVMDVMTHSIAKCIVMSVTGEARQMRVCAPEVNAHTYPNVKLANRSSPSRRRVDLHVMNLGSMRALIGMLALLVWNAKTGGRTQTKLNQ